MNIFLLVLASKILCKDGSYNFETLLKTIFSKEFHKESLTQQKVEILTTIKLMYICALIELNDNCVKDKISISSKKEVRQIIEAFEHELIFLIERFFDELNVENVEIKLEKCSIEIYRIMNDFELEKNCLLEPLEIVFALPVQYINYPSCFKLVYKELSQNIWNITCDSSIKMLLARKLDNLIFLKEKTIYEAEDLILLFIYLRVKSYN